MLFVRRRSAFYGVRFLSTKSVRAIVSVLVCLASTIRSQGFSPSQRFDPARTSWPCFVPHPSIGLRSSERSPLSQPWELSNLATLVSLASSNGPEEPSSPLSSAPDLSNRKKDYNTTFCGPWFCRIRRRRRTAVGSTEAFVLCLLAPSKEPKLTVQQTSCATSAHADCFTTRVDPASVGCPKTSGCRH